MRYSSVMAKRWMSFWTVRLLRNTVWIRRFSSLNFHLPHWRRSADIPVCVYMAVRNNSAICIFKVLLIHRKELIEKCNSFIYLKETAHINEEPELAKGYIYSPLKVKRNNTTNTNERGKREQKERGKINNHNNSRVAQLTLRGYIKTSNQLC